MALMFVDGFDAGDFAVKWDATLGAATSTTTRLSTGRSITIPNGGYVSKGLPATSQMTLGAALMVSANLSWFIYLYGDGGTTLHLTVTRNSTSGLVQLYRSSNTLLAVGSRAIQVNEWAYVEVRATIADAGGTVEVRINGVTDISFTGDTKNAGTNSTIDAVRFSSNSTNVYVDDVYILDSTGTSNTTFLGDIRVQTLSPSGNGTNSALTGSDANSIDNYLLVDDVPYDTADYVGSSNIGDRDTYVLSDLDANTSAVLGVQNSIIAAKTDASSTGAKSILYIGLSYYGTAHAVGTSYRVYADIYDVNPNTTVAWTIGDVNGMEAGMEVA